MYLVNNIANDRMIIAEADVKFGSGVNYVCMLLDADDR